MAQQPRFVVADGHIDSKTTDAAGISPSKYVFQFSSDLYFCGKDVGGFTNNVKCRKWTDLSGNYFNTPCLVDPPGPPQPDKGCIVNVGDVTLLIERNAPPARKIVCENFELEGTQTHRIKVLLSSFVVFLFTGEGEGKAMPISATSGGDSVTVKGVGSCLETLVPNGPPRVDSWNFVFTIC